MVKKAKRIARPRIEAAGGIVIRGRARPLFAVVQLRRQKAWVLPKGKLNRGETALAAARREVIEETGHDVEVFEFLGRLDYVTGGRPKIVRFWRMEASRRPVSKLMRDVRAVRWLTLAQAKAQLTHEREKLFLEKVGTDIVRRRRETPVRDGSASAARAGPEIAAAAEIASSALPRVLTAAQRTPALMRKLWTLLRRRA